MIFPVILSFVLFVSSISFVFFISAAPKIAFLSSVISAFSSLVLSAFLSFVSLAFVLLSFVLPPFSPLSCIALSFVTLSFVSSASFILSFTVTCSIPSELRTRILTRLAPTGNGACITASPSLLSVISNASRGNLIRSPVIFPIICDREPDWPSK